MSKTPFSPESWEKYYTEIGLDRVTQEQYLIYVRNCYKNKIPPIFELEHLSLLVGIEYIELRSMIFGTHRFYRKFKIRKKRGGFREISAPLPSLLSVQQWINENILSKVKISICATGFRPRKSILTNAKIHCNRRTILKVDLSDFFPSIDIRRVIGVFRELGYPANVAVAMARLCCENGKLPQGSAASPALANIICRGLDLRLYQLSKKNKLRYTRYADDIALSGDKIAPGIRKLIFEIISDEGFKINNEKIRFLDEDDSKIITGLDISSGTPRVTRSYRRDLKRDIYFVWSSGLANHLSRRRIFEPNYLEVLSGRLRFWEFIEPQSTQMLQCKSRLSETFKLHGEYQSRQQRSA